MKQGPTEIKNSQAFTRPGVKAVDDKENATRMNNFVYARNTLRS